MNSPSPNRMKWIIALICLAAVAVGWGTQSRWRPAVNGWLGSTSGSAPEANDEHADEHGHDHGHDHDDSTSLELSQQAKRNLGLSAEYLQPIKLETYWRSITVPAVIVERPGRTRLDVATPMTGVVMHVHAVEGEAVEPGTLLFQIRLTHEDLVQIQTEFLRTLGELDVELKEIARLEPLVPEGAVSGKTLLDRQYARDKLEAVLKAQHEGLKLHGLSEEQVQQITTERRLLRELQIFAPSSDEHPETELKLADEIIHPAAYSQPSDKEGSTAKQHPLVIQQLAVHKGEAVAAGQALCVLSDYGELFIEGLAFEQDAGLIAQAVENDWQVSAVFDSSGSKQAIEKLSLAYLANEVNAESRTLRFYVELPNELIRDKKGTDGRRYVAWKFRPGQRLELRVPVEKWADEIVLPVEAVAQEGAEYFVFQENGNHFDRVPVHVKHRDQSYVVIANDGSLFPGDVVARRGAHQMQMALKNKAGGGVDPHAGHSH